MAVGADADDWLVADSEEEDAFAQIPPANGSGASTKIRAAAADNLTSPETSEIQMVFNPGQPRTPPRGRQSPSTLGDESLFIPPDGGMDSTIDNFTSVPSTSGGPSAMVSKPRPRPRVVMKKVATFDDNHNADVANTSFSHISDPPISATRRASDRIRPETATSFSFSEVVNDAYSSFDIAERAKMRSRKSQTAKKSIRSPVQINEVIELTSDEDELSLKPTKRQKKQGVPVPKPKVQTRPRPKPKLRVKPASALPSGSPQSRDPPMPPAQCMSSSQLPASTFPTIPPSTPLQARELSPLSSPPVTTRKRKRIRPSIVEDDDEMNIIDGNLTAISPSLTMPPPFFAPSSSSAPTDSGIEIPPVESLRGRGKKKQASPSKKGTRKKAQNKGKKGKKGEMTGAVDGMVEESAGLTQEPSTPAMHHGPKEPPSPVARNSTATNASGEKMVTEKGKTRAIDSCEEEDEPVLPSKFNTVHAPLADEGEGQESKENSRPDDLTPNRDPPTKHISSIGRGLVKAKLTPMSELIWRVNSQPSSPFPNTSRTYSPFLKSSRTMLSRIAPLHPNRRIPPPPLPRPPPPKKSKKQLEMEERIEEELAETIDGWSCLTDDERKALRNARIDAELGFE